MAPKTGARKKQTRPSDVNANAQARRDAIAPPSLHHRHFTNRTPDYIEIVGYSRIVHGTRLFRAYYKGPDDSYYCYITKWMFDQGIRLPNEDETVMVMEADRYAAVGNFAPDVSIFIASIYKTPSHRMSHIKTKPAQ